MLGDLVLRPFVWAEGAWLLGFWMVDILVCFVLAIILLALRRWASCLHFNFMVCNLRFVGPVVIIAMPGLLRCILMDLTVLH